MNELDANAKTIFLEAVEQDVAAGAARVSRCGLRRRPGAPGSRRGIAAGPRAGRELPRRRLRERASPRTGRRGPRKVIGPYKLVEEIGEGGFGIVFLAEQQQPVRRKVALKIIKPGMDTRQVIARFEAERQALALMDHPNIARVLDAGQTELGPALLRDGAGQGRPDHPVLRRAAS